VSVSSLIENAGLLLIAAALLVVLVWNRIRRL
jgi:hypothetical protein